MSFFDSLARSFLSNLPAGTQNQILQATLGFLQQQGGVGQLVNQFHAHGLGATIESWINPGPNQPISSGQVHEVFGAAQIQQLADQLGVTPGNITTGLSQILPNLVDKLTPDGAVPSDSEIEPRLAAIFKDGLGKLLG